MKIYIALDGAADVTAAERARKCAAFGAAAHVIVPPGGMDPDEIPIGQWADLIDYAPEAWRYWAEVIKNAEGKDSTKQAAEFARYLARLEGVDPGPAAAVRRRATCDILGIDAQEYRTWIRKAVQEQAGDASAKQAGAGGDGMAAIARNVLPHDWETAHKFDAAGIGDSRPVISNFYVESRVESQEYIEGVEGGDDKRKRKILARPIGAIIKRIQELMSNSVGRLRSPGSREPLLFAEVETISLNGKFFDPHFKWWEKSVKWKAFLHQICRLQFRDKTDAHGVRFVTEQDLFYALGESVAVAEYRQVQTRPHWPRISDHYYAWQETISYEPTGEKLSELLAFFTNSKTPEKDLPLMLAALMTPGWGGGSDAKYGIRPFLVFTAADQGSGKTTLAHTIAELWGGLIPLQQGRRQEEEFITRALSPGGLTSRCVVLDNVHGTLKWGALESWITEKTLSGKRMYAGEASRPNDLTWMGTMNNAQLGRDMSLRSFVIELKKPTYRSGWTEDIQALLARHGREIVADIISILQQPKKGANLGGSDRFAVWVEEVLRRACEWPGLLEFLDKAPDVKAIIEANDKVRKDADVDAEQAIEFWSVALDELCDYFTEVAILADGTEGENVYKGAADDVPDEILVPPVNKKKGDRWAVNVWLQTAISPVSLRPGWVKGFVTRHHEAGRLPHIYYKRTGTNRGYLVSGEPVRVELEKRAKIEAEAKS